MRALNDIEFEQALKKALITAAEADCMRDMPPDEKLGSQLAPSAKFGQKMTRLIKNPKSYIKSQKRPPYRRFLNTAAMIVLAVSMLLGVSMLYPPVRASVTKLTRTWADTHSRYENTGEDAPIIPTSVTLGYVPDGFELVLEDYHELGIAIVYQAEDGTFLSLDISWLGKFYINNEHSDFYTMTIDNYSVDVYESNDANYQSILVCHDENRNITINIIAYLDVDELAKIISNMEFE